MYSFTNCFTYVSSTKKVTLELKNIKILSIHYTLCHNCTKKVTILLFCVHLYPLSFQE